MRLYFNPASPFARKVRVVAIETGLDDQIEIQNVQLTPVAPAAALIADNPLSKLPCLVTEDGDPLYDSRVIAEYLDSLHGGARLFPGQGPARWTALRRQALADGIMDAAVLTRYESFVRPAEYQWAAWTLNQSLKWRRALDRLEDEVSEFEALVDIGTLAIACALCYLDFRFADEGWREQRPKLAAWFKRFATRKSMIQTQPTA